MSLVVEGQTYKWDGGTLEELLALLAEAALSVRVEALHAERDEKVGELHVVAGGVSETIAGDRRGDAAMTYLRQIPGLRFLAHPTLAGSGGRQTWGARPARGLARAAAAARAHAVLRELRPHLRARAAARRRSRAGELPAGRDPAHPGQRQRVGRTPARGHVLDRGDLADHAAPAHVAPAPQGHAPAARPRRRQQHDLRVPGPAAACAGGDQRGAAPPPSAQSTLAADGALFQHHRPRPRAAAAG